MMNAAKLCGLVSESFSDASNLARFNGSIAPSPLMTKVSFLVALARKVLCILYHLLMNREDYSRAWGWEDQTKNTQLHLTCKHDGYRWDDKDHLQGRIPGGKRFEGGQRVTAPSCFLDVFHVKQKGQQYDNRDNFSLNIYPSHYQSLDNNTILGGGAGTMGARRTQRRRATS